MKKSNLPKNWIICSSKSYPDKVYYFNKVTNKTSWESPLAQTQNETPSKKEDTKKRKLETDPEISRPRTPDMTQEKERPVLQAKRRISLISQKTSNETPQMREIRERMLQKQGNLNKGLKSISTKGSSSNNRMDDKASACKISTSKITENKVVNIVESGIKTLETETNNAIKDAKGTIISENEISSSTKQRRRISEIVKPLPRKPGRRLSTVGSGSSNKEHNTSINCSQSAEQNLTPQMRLLYEKLEQKKAQKNVSSRKSVMSSAQSSSSNSTSTTSSSTSESSGISSTSSSTSNSVFTSAANRLTSSKTGEPEKSPNSLKRTQNAVITRRRSRLLSLSPGIANTASDVPDALHLPTLGEEIEPEDTKSKEKVPKRKSTVTPTSARKHGRTMLIQSQEPDINFKIASKSPTTNFPKNIAKKRLDDIREKQINLERNQNSRATDSSSLNIQPLIKDPGPEVTLYTNATARAKNVRDRVLIYQSCTANMNKKRHLDDFDAEVIENQSMLAKLKDHSNDPYYEEMDWEPIEDEKIMCEVQAVRSQLYTRSIDHTNVIQENILKLSSESTEKSDKTLYIVVDTNVFLSNLLAIEEVRDAIFKSFGRPFIIVPWTVLQELDFIKDDKSATRPESLRVKARKAVRFLNLHFSTKHPRILGQTPQDVVRNKEIFATDCPDDEILQSCLQIRNSGRLVVLLSYDKNLCNKAMIYDIVTLGRDDPFEKIEFLNIDNQGNNSFSTGPLSFNIENHDNIKTALEDELLVAEDIFEKTKDVLLNFISPIVVIEMHNLYGDCWERYTIIRPPWSTKDALKCAIKHWMAAVGESFMRRAESILKELLDAINNPPVGGRRLKHVRYVLERFSDLMQTLNQHKHPNLLNKTTTAVDALKTRCIEETKRICEKRVRDEIGHEDNITRQNDRAEIALNYFNKVYAFTRDFCGTAAEAINMPCPFLFEKTDKQFSANFVKDYQPVLAANLNHLLQLLSLALEDMNGLRPDHKAVIVLTEALTTFLPEEFNESNMEITPLDLYYLMKTKEDIMKRGLTQLQDLSQQFCRMASFRCK